MTHQQAWQLLSDYVDGTLSAAQADAVARHVESCDACRHEVAALRELIARAEALPRSVEPPRDLWPGIAAAISAGEAEETAGQTDRASAPDGWRTILSRWRGSFRGHRWAWSSAVATAAVAVLAVILILEPQTGDGPPPSAERARSQGMATDDRLSAGLADEGPLAPDITAVRVVNALEAETRGSGLELAHLSETHTCEESRTIMESIAHEIQTIDLAIAEAKDAWTSDPNSPGLARLLSSYYRAKAALQGRASEVAARVSC